MGRGGAQTGVEQVVRHLQAPALLLDREQRVHLANDAATRLLSRGELVGTTLGELLGPALQVRGAHAWAACLAGEVVGDLRAAAATYALVPVAQPSGPVAALALLEAPTCTTAVSELLDEALASAPLCLVAFDAEAFVTYAAGAGFAALGADPAATVGADVLALYGRSVPVGAAIRRCLGGERVDVVLPYGGRVWDLHLRPVLQDGVPAGGMCTAMDVTDWLAGAAVPSSTPVPAATARTAPGPSTRRAGGRRPVVDEAQVLADLRDAVATGQLSVDYQPVVRVSDRVTTGVEALVRWEHPLRGRLRPSDFLDLASRTGLLLPLGDRVLRQACHAIAGWNREALDGRALQVSVNLSAQQLLQPGLRGLVQEALVVAECRPEWLALEVTEAAITSDEQAAAAALDALRSLGVAVALDDAGTGVGSSTWLRRYGFDVLKIDRSFVAGLGLGDGRGDVVASLVSLAGRLGVRCVAEGVETVGQLALLQGLGCELAQGYLFSRPMSAEDTTTWLQRATAPVRPQPGAEAAGVPVSSLQRALELHAEGASLHTVAARLNLEGRLAAKGRRWHHTSVARMLAGHQFPQLRV